MTGRWSALSVSGRAAALAIAVTAVLVVVVGPAPASAQSGLLGQWRFDEPDGQRIIDDGPHALAGFLGSSDGADAADPVRVPGASGGALHFDGDRFVQLPDSASLAASTLTVEAVVRAGTSPGAWRYLVSRGGHGCVAGSYGLYTGEAGGVALYVFDGTRYVVSATAQSAGVWNGAWHHVAGTFDGRALRLFVDGRAVGEPMDAPLRIDYAGTSARLSIGQYAGDCELSFRGDIDLVRLSSGARSQETLASSAAAAGVPPAAGPLPPAASGTTIPGNAAPDHPSAPPRRACVVKLVRRHRAARGRTVVRVRVSGRHRPLRTRVVARRVPGGRLIATARTNGSGIARLALPAQRSARVRISARKPRRCTPAVLRVHGS